MDAEIKTIPVCSPDDRWTKESTWAIMKPGRKSAVRVLKSEVEAVNYAKALKGVSIVKRPGEDIRCVDYCSVCQWCPYWQEKYKEVEDDSKNT